MLYRELVRFIGASVLVSGCADAAVVDGRQAPSGGATTAQATPTTPIPDYLQTSLGGPFAGPTQTGEAPFLVQINPAPFPSVSYIPIAPLETQVPIAGNTNNSNIFQLMGQLSHYFPNPSGFGVNEYPLPAGAKVSQLHMLHRHGSRYPTTGAGAVILGLALQNASMTGKLNATGQLAFLNDYRFKLGAEILVPVGKSELFDSGTLHYYQYGHLYPNNGSKIIARSTTQDRMLQSAEYFLAGFFGLAWTKNATLELVIEKTGYNDTLAGYFQCNNSNNNRSSQGTVAAGQWEANYLQAATTRLNKLTTGFNWTTALTYNAQDLCAYETVALGYSPFCGLFTYDEWRGYEYAIDIAFAGNNAFQSPTGRAVGIGYVQEVLARLNHHLLTSPVAQINVTLDNNPTTFPLDQALNFDFSHDTNIMSILTAFGLTQFSTFLPTSQIIPHDLVVSHLEPFGARLDIEVITAPHPVSPNRTAAASTASYMSGNTTQYVHFVMNQRTIPLGKSFQECGQRDDGWCELKTFLQVQSQSLQLANYDYACFGNYDVPTYGSVSNGAPVK